MPILSVQCLFVADLFGFNGIILSGGGRNWLLSCLGLKYHRYSLNLHQCLLLEEAGDLEEGCCRVIVAEVGAMHHPKLLQVRLVIVAVANEDGDFHDILQCAACCLDDCLQVAQHLLVLRNQIASNNIALRVAARLPGQEEQATAGSQNAMTEASGPGQRWRIDDFSYSHRLSYLPVNFGFSFALNAS